MEWLSLQDEMLYLHILFFIIKGLIFHHSLTHLLASLTLSLKNIMPTHSHTQLLYLSLMVLLVIQFIQIYENKVKQLQHGRLINQQFTDMIYLVPRTVCVRHASTCTHTHMHTVICKCRQMLLHSICKSFLKINNQLKTGLSWNAGAPTPVCQFCGGMLRVGKSCS